MITPLFDTALAALLALPLSILAVHLLATLADRNDWVDAPGGRKRHRHEVPLVGGLGLMAGACASLLLLDVLDRAESTLMAALLLTCATGWVDDRRPINAPIRFTLHLASAAIACWPASIVLTTLGNPFGLGPIELGWLAIPFTVVALTGVANAFNLIDGLDGLAGGLALIALGWFVAILAAVGLRGSGAAALEALTVPAVFGAAVLGFLRFNLRSDRLKHAEVFLGSAGSVTLGLLMAWLAVRTTQTLPRGATPVTALWILALPLFDTLSVMLRRLQSGVSPARPDRRHLHHLVMARGLRTRQAVQRLHVAAVTSGGIGVMGWLAGVPEPVMFWSLVAAFVGYHVYACRYWSKVDRRLAAEAVKAQPAPVVGPESLSPVTRPLPEELAAGR